jgi:hypothetical protein
VHVILLEQSIFELFKQNMQNVKGFTKYVHSGRFFNCITLLHTMGLFGFACLLGVDAEMNYEAA